MRYQGGKSKAGKYILAAMKSKLADLPEICVEPFIGGANMTSLLAREFSVVRASDYNEDIFCLWNDVAQGWLPPETISREEYLEAKGWTEPSALRGFIGFGCSFGGKWFGGFANGGGRDHANESFRNVAKIQEVLMGVDFSIQHCSYDELEIPDGCVVYCDPPYQGTLGYKNAGEFDSEHFWDVMNQWSERAHVFVSEGAIDTPSGWELLWGRTQGTGIDLASQKKQVETLFYKGITPW